LGDTDQEEGRMSDIAHMDIAEFRELGYLQEVNRRVLHPLGLALEVTVMDRESDDSKMIEVIAPVIQESLMQMNVSAEQAREAARLVVSKLWPRGSERISGVWDYRDDPEGVYFGAGELDVNKADRIEAILSQKLRRREEILGFGVQGPADVAEGERQDDDEPRERQP
jgi:hypothetical protein